MAAILYKNKELNSMSMDIFDARRWWALGYTVVTVTTCNLKDEHPFSAEGYEWMA